MAKKRGNREGSIFHKSNGTWRAQVTLEGRRLSFTSDTRKGCQDWLKKTLGQIDGGLKFDATKITVAEYLKDWLASVRLNRRPRTAEQYIQICDAYVQPILGRIKLKDLQPEQIQRMYNQLVEDRHGAFLVIKLHTILSSALSQAVQTGAILRNPASLAHPPRPPVKEMAILDTSQISQLFVTIKDHRLAPLIHLAINTGMRQMELLGLKWSDLDWIKKTLKIERQLERDTRNEVHFASPKTRAGRRTIFLDQTTLDILKKHLERQNTERIHAGDQWINHGLIFCTSVGTPLNPRNVLRDFKRFLKEAGLPELRFHDLRHTSASLLLNNGYSPLVVSKRLGHTRTSITMDIYGHLHPIQEMEAAEKISELITPVAVAPDDMAPKTIAPGCTRLHPN